MNHMHITKTGEDRYHATENDNFIIDEDVNDNQLRGMLGPKILIGTTCAAVLAHSESQGVGYMMTITYE
jgi:hypothetical protein